jgi:hypothetical protein
VTGATGTSDPPGATGASGPSVPITHATVLPTDPSSPVFLTGTTATGPGTTTIVLDGKNQDALIQAGTGYVQNFSVAQDKLDLTQLLAGAPLAHDLTNIGNFVQVLGSGPNDPGFGSGTKTTLEVSGPGGSAVVNLEGSGKIDLNDLLKHNSLILPPH